jgi:hypothetical protein
MVAAALAEKRLWWQPLQDGGRSGSASEGPTRERELGISLNTILFLVSE